MSEASATTRRELVGDVSTTTGVTGSIFLAGILTESEDARNVNTNTHTNYETDEGSKFDIKCSDFLVYDEDVPNLHDEEDNRNFMRKYWKWVSWEEVGDDEGIQGPPYIGNYNVPRRLKTGVANIFNTVLRCIFECTAMNRCFQRLSSQINNYTHSNISGRNSIL